MPRGFDHDIRKQVDMSVDQGDGSYPKGRCIHCEKIIAVTASTIKRHLKGCGPYEKHRLEHPELHPESTEMTPRKSINKTPKTPKSTPGNLQPVTVSVGTDAGLRACQYQAAKAIFVSGQPFGLYSNPDMRELFRMLNPAFHPPTEEELSTDLLDLVYGEYMKRVRSEIDAIAWLNIHLEAVQNSGEEMLFNVCVSPAPGTTYYWTRINTGDIEVTASNRLHLLRPILLEITSNNLQRIMSYTMATERVLEETNFAFCPIRNRLPQERIEKLSFIYHNHRVLKQKSKNWPQLTETEIEEMENILFQH
jgi:hypothetical protein